MRERQREGEPSCGGGFTHKDAPDDIPTEPPQHSDPVFVAGDEASVRNRIMLLLMGQMANENMWGPQPTATNKARRVKSGREYDTSGSSVPTAMVGHTVSSVEDATTNGSRRRDSHADMSYGTSCWAHAFMGQRVHQKVSCGVVLHSCFSVTTNVLFLICFGHDFKKECVPGVLRPVLRTVAIVARTSIVSSYTPISALVNSASSSP